MGDKHSKVVKSMVPMGIAWRATRDKGKISGGVRARDVVDEQRLSSEQAQLLGRLDDALKNRLTPKRYRHSLGVCQTAGFIADAYEANYADACIAGLVHDWNKKLADDDLLEIARQIGFFFPDGHERDVIALLHAPTGAHSLAQEFGELSPEILQAVARHTTGAVDMTDLDMIVYVADMIEPSRSWEGVDDLRSKVGQDSLANLYFAGYAQSMLSLFRRGRYVYPPAIAIWNELVTSRAE